MKSFLATFLTPILLIGFGCGLTTAAEPKVQLRDDGLPLQELRPNDRRDYVLVLDGKWTEPALPGVEYYVNELFPDGASYSHKVLNDRLFALGDVRVLLPEHQLIRHGVAKGGTINIVISARRPAASAAAEDVVSSPFSVSWPMNRPVVQELVRSKHTPPPAVDVFPPPEPVKPPAR
jgi:hypothetical protein